MDLRLISLIFTMALASQFSSAQYGGGANDCFADDCIDGAGQTTPVPGCCTATTAGMSTSYGGTYNSTVGPYTCPLSNGQDTWVTFMAPSTGFLTVDFTQVFGGPSGTPISGSVTMVVFDSFSNADNCSTLNAGGVITAVDCFDGAAGVTDLQLNSVQIGERYFILISTPPGETPGDFEVCLDIITPTGGMDCIDATPLCATDNQQLDAIGSGPGAVFGDGSYEDLSTTANGNGPGSSGIANSCWGGGPYVGGEVNTQWYTFTASNDGTLGMAIAPNDIQVTGGCPSGTVTSADYDWMILDVSTAIGDNPEAFTCNINGSNFGGSDSASVVACDWSGQEGITGFGGTGPGDYGYNGTGDGCQLDDSYSGSSTFAWNAGDINLVTGNTYALVISNYSGTTAGFDLEWGGTATFGVQPVAFSAPVINDCQASITLTSPLDGSGNLIWSYDYLIDWGDGTTTTSGSTNLSHSYAIDSTFTITVLVTDPSGCFQGYSETVVVPCTLPVELIDFDGKEFGLDNILYWQTATETSSDYYIIEKRTDLSKGWELLDTVAAAGFSQVQNSYSVTDERAAKLTYYKLSQVDFDGSIHTYPAIVVDRENINTDEIFSDVSPNPAVDYISFQYSGNDFTTPIQVEIYSTDGRQCILQSFIPSDTDAQYSLNIGSLDTGSYFAKITQGDKVEIKNFVIRN